MEWPINEISTRNCINCIEKGDSVSCIHWEHDYSFNTVIKCKKLIIPCIMCKNFESFEEI
jgi:hypothetical protein